MHLTPRESERLMVHMMGELAAQRKARGVKLNYVETIAYITSDIYERVRDGKLTVLELMDYGAHLLTSDDVMDGVAEMLPALSVEATFPDGTKQITIHNPIRKNESMKSSVVPGEIFYKDEEIEGNVGKETITITVKNTDKRPIAVGSHMHFFEVNRFLEFDRAAAYGYKLDIPSGTVVRWEPGDEKTVTLTRFGGRQVVKGLNGLTNGQLSEYNRGQAILNANVKGFIK